MCGSMADIQSPTAEIRRGKKRKKNKRQDENIYGLPYYVGRPYIMDLYLLPSRAAVTFSG